MPLALFVTDLDHTLIGDDVAMETLNQRLIQYRNANGTRVVYATGRSPTLYGQLQSKKNLITPDALVTAVGTEIYYSGSANPDLNWSEQFSCNWNRDLVATVASQLTDLTPQPDSEQRPFKASYFLPKNVATQVLQNLEKSLNSEGLDVEVVYSDGKDLDLLPRNANKGRAMAFLQKKWGIDAAETVVCGDSGNDISLFNVGAEKGIIVGNAKRELLVWLKSNGSPNHYLAKKFCASGILEGLDHFNF